MTGSRIGSRLVAALFEIDDGWLMVEICLSPLYRPVIAILFAGAGAAGI